jgi:hypothetical protein
VVDEHNIYIKHLIFQMLAHISLMNNAGLRWLINELQKERPAPVDEADYQALGLMIDVVTIYLAEDERS